MTQRFDPLTDDRRVLRLPDDDYRQPGAYFLTVCTHRRGRLFGGIVDGDVRLSPAGDAVHACWMTIPDHFPAVTLDAWVVMPNHVHGIIMIDDAGSEPPTRPAAVGATHASPLPCPEQSSIHGERSPRPAGPVPQSIGAIVGAFKSAASKRINSIRPMPGGPVWQRNYYEHVIRNEASLERLRRYIRENPARWEARAARGR